MSTQSGLVLVGECSSVKVLPWLWCSQWNEKQGQQLRYGENGGGGVESLWDEEGVK